MVCIAGQVSENPKTRPRLVGPVAPMLCGKCPSFGTEAGGLNRSPAGDLKDHFFWISLEGKRTGTVGRSLLVLSQERSVSGQVALAVVEGKSEGPPTESLPGRRCWSMPFSFVLGNCEIYAIVICIYFRVKSLTLK